MLRNFLPTLLVVTLIALFALPAPAEERFTVDDFVALPMVGKGELSPDGQKLAWHRVTRDLKKNTYLRQIWIADLKSGETRQLTREPGQSWSPMWAPRGEGLVFSSSRGGKVALYLTRLDGTDPERLMKSPASHPVFSPDGRKIAFLAPAKKDPKRPGFGKDPEVWTAIEDATKWPQLWIYDRKTKKRKQLSDGTTYVYDFDWHPDGTRLAYTFDPKGSEGLTEDHHLGVIDLDGKSKTIADGPVKYTAPRWSPDGTRLAYWRDRAEPLDVYLTVNDLWVADPEKKTAPTNLTRDFPGSPSGRFSSGADEPPRWSPDGKWIWFVSAERTNLNIHRVASAGGGKVEAITRVDGEISRLSFDRAFRYVAFAWTDFTHPADLFVTEARPQTNGSFAPRQITHVRKLVKKYDLRMPERLTWKSPDGTEIEGFLFLPRGAADGKPAPVMFDAHGGPAFRWGNGFSYRYMWHVFADHGIGSLIFNPRGSTAYGEEFLRGNFMGFGQGDFQDLMAAVDLLIKRGVTAPDRIGMTGYSYGGFLTNLAISHTDRFQVAVTIAGGFNFASGMGQSNSILPRSYYQPMKSEENMRRMLEHSPITRAMKVKTPTLILHGKADTAVHYMQAVEMFTSLQLAGCPSKLVLYPGEGHGINKPEHMRHYLEASVRWIQKHLAGWEEAGGAKLEKAKKDEKKEEKKDGKRE